MLLSSIHMKQKQQALNYLTNLLPFHENIKTWSSMQPTITTNIDIN
jgi:hypothetical protein